MKRISLKPVAALALAAALPCAAGAPAGSLSEGAVLWLNARVEISPAGKVTTLVWSDADDVRGVVAERVESAVRSWTFEPGTIDGVPQPTSTHLRLKLRARPQGEALALQIEDASTGARSALLVPPRYPTAAVRAGVDAAVLATVAVAADGAVSVESIDVRASRPRYNEQFEKATRAAIAQWSYTPERVGGRPVATRMQVPVTYCVTSLKCEDQFRTPADAAAPRFAGPPSQPVALQSAVRLVDEVAGRTL